MGNYLVIGGSSGIGQAIVHELHEQGNHVYASYYTASHLQRKEGIYYFEYDVRQSFPSDLALPDQLDGFVYCPGAIDLKPFARNSPENFETDFQLQVLGAIRSLQAVLPFLLKSEHASVVLFSTVAVQSGFPFHSVVSTSKGAIEGLCRALAAEYAQKIRFNTIAPSLTDTPLAGRLLNNEEKKEANAQRHPMKKIGQPEDLANMALFLLSNKSAWVTGQILPVDGGMSSLKVG